MRFKEYSNKLVSSTNISIIYFIICSLYIIFSDRFLLFFFEENISNETLSEIQSYKGVFFVLVSSLLIYYALKKRDKIVIEYTKNLKKNQKQYQDLFENMSHGVIYATPKGIVTSVNESTLQILGITEKEMIGKSIFDTSWKPIDSKRELIGLHDNPAKRAIINKKSVRNNIVGVVNVKTGLYTWLKVNAIPEFENGNKEPFRVCVTIDDVTQLKTYQEELEESKDQINASLKKTQFNEFLLKEASKLAKLGAYEVHIDTENAYFSHLLHDLFEFPANDKFPLKGVAKFLTEESNAILGEGVKACMEYGTIVDEILDLKVKDDKHLKYRVIIKPIYNDNNKIIGRRGVVQDITEQKKVEEKIVQSEQRFKALVQEGSDLYAIIDKSGNYVYMSPSSIRIIGIPPEEFIGKNAFEFLHPDDTENALESLNKVVTEDRVVMQHYRAKNHKNKWRWVETVLTNMLNNPAVNGIVVNSRDITAQVEQEKKLIEAKEEAEENERRMNEAQKIANLGSWYFDVINKVFEWSEETYNIWGFDSEKTSIEFLDHQKRISPKDWEYFITVVDDATKKGIPFKMELELTMPDASKKIVNAIAKPIFNEKNQVIAFKGTTQDITDQIAIENELRQAKDKAEESEYSIREAGRIAKIGYWSYDKEKDIISWSDQIHKIYGTNPEKEVPSLDVILSFFTEKSKKEIVEATIELAIKGTPYELELNLINSKNENIWIRNLGQPIYNKQNEIIGRRGVSQNITKEKNDQLALLKAKEKVERNQNIMNQASKVAKIGYWYQDLVHNTLTWSDYIYQLYKLKPEDDILRYDVAKSYFDAESQEKISIANKKLNEFGTPYDLELRVVFSKNEELWIRNMVQPVYNEHKKIIGKRGVIQNITVEKNLRELNRQVASLAKIGSWEVNLVDKTVFWSEEVHIIHGTNPETYNPQLDEAINFYRKDFHELIKSSVEKCISKGKSYDLEAVIITADKKELWVRSNAKAEFSNGVCTRIFGSFQDINERKQAEIAVQESETKFRTIFEIASLGIAQVDPSNGKIILINSYYETITGYSVEELLKMKFSELTHPDDLEGDLELFYKAARGEEDYSNEKRYIKKDGNIVWVRIHLAFIRDENGNPKKTVAICEDITQRKEAESRLQSLADNLPGVVFQYFLYPDNTDKLKAITAGSQEVWGFTAKDVEQNNQLVWSQVEAGGDLDIFKTSISESIKTQTKWSAQWKYVMPNGEIKTHLGYGSPNLLADGTVMFNSVILDVTEEAKNELLLEQTNKIAKIGSWEMDLISQEGDKMFWSPSIKEILEIDSNYNPTLKDGIEFHIGESRERIKNALMLLIKDGIEFDEEILLRTATGKQRWCRAIGKSEIINGKNTRIYGSYQDIHEKKIAMQELKKSLKSLKDFKYSLDQSAIIAFTNQKGEITSVNENFCEITGYNKNEVIRKTLKILNSNYHSELFFKELWKTITSGKVWRGEIKNKTKDGSYYWVDATIVPFLDENNKPTQYLAINFDITERKKVEEEKTRFQETLENSLNEVYMFDYETYKFIYVNKGAIQNLGYSKEEIKELTPLDLKANHTASTFNELLAPLHNNEKSKVVFFTNHIRKDGSIYPVEVHITLVDEANHKNFIAIVLDITERKKAQENLLLTTERLRIATTSVKIGIWDWDVVNDILTWDDRMLELYGVKKENFDGALSAWQKSVHPDDLEWTNKHLLDTINGVHNFNSVFRVVWPDKSIHYIEANATVIRDKEGIALRMIGGNIDVTESKKIQSEILKAKEQVEISEAKFKSYTEKSPIAIFTTDLSGSYTYVNETWLSLTGLVLEEALSPSGWSKAIHPSDLKKVNKNWYKSVKSNGKWKYEYRFINKKTENIIWVEATAKELFNDKNELIGYLGTNVNITDRKKAEEMYRLLADNTNDIIALQEPNSNIKYISPAVESLLGYKQDELLKKQFREVIHKDDMTYLDEEFNKKLLKGIVIEAITYRAQHKKGHFVWLETLISPIMKDNEIVSLISTSRDVTQWMFAKKEIEDYQSSLQKLTSEISLIEEKQKKEIAANIHDHLSQSLVISKMRITELEKKTELKNIQKDLEFIKSHISNALENSRTITYELSPPVLYQLGVVHALDWFAEEIEEKYGIKFNFKSNVDSIKLTDFKSILIFRCVQEAVTNTIKYAEATLITLELFKHKNAVDILITDNGKGFDTAVLNSGGSSSSGFGLFAVKERIRSLNGKFTITSELKIGTKIKIYVPLDI